MNICVFCSQYDVAEKYKGAAETLARLIAEHKYALVWGGADEGLMGLIARTAQRGRSRVIGVIQEKIKDKAYKNADEMIVVKNGRDMNLGLIERGDVIIVLVGGIGTLNELTEIVRMKKDGEQNKPVVIVNTDHFYDGLKQQLQRMNDEGFLRDDIMNSVHFVGTPEEAMHHLDSHGR
ncbi:MAG: TIGR00730 family Rossman fold protein [bacterium]|nr:TIGR00730 family Rossman fold protein [bacterium]